ncbi:hypothetical protein BDF14DRAFT_1819181 [Spinellus fusiger]|nr:hypothetical protein BDF14DRAFT_1819181 [Spinellus fusiger]
MQVAGPTGFYNVLVTKALVLWIGVCSLLGSLFQQKILFHLQLYPHLTVHHQLWRCVSSHSAFGSSSDLLYGLLVLYTMRVVEQWYGSAKYAAFVFFAVVVSTALEICALAVGAFWGWERIPGGPYALLFAMLYQYYVLIPVVYRFKVFGIVLSNKTPLYVLALELALSQGFHTLVPSLCGALAGLLYRVNVAHIRQWRFPSTANYGAVRWIQPWLSAPPLLRSTMTMPVQQASVGYAVERLVSAAGLGTRPAQRTPSAVPEENPVRAYLDTLTGRTAADSGLTPPPEEHVTMLSTMFPEHPPEAITRALAAAHNDPNRAVEVMLNTPAPEGSSVQ